MANITDSALACNRFIWMGPKEASAVSFPSSWFAGKTISFHVPKRAFSEKYEAAGMFQVAPCSQACMAGKCPGWTVLSCGAWGAWHMSFLDSAQNKLKSGSEIRKINALSTLHVQARRIWLLQRHKFFSIRQADSPACFWRFDDKELCQGTSRWLMRSTATLSFRCRVLAGRSCATSLLLLDSFAFLIPLCRQRRRLMTLQNCHYPVWTLAVQGCQQQVLVIEFERQENAWTHHFYQ